MDHPSFLARRYLHSLIAQSAIKEAPGGRSGIERNHDEKELKKIIVRMQNVTRGRSSLPKKYRLTPQMLDEVYHSLIGTKKELK